MQLAVKAIVNVEMTALSFKRLGLHWYKPYSEVIHVVELRKSQWGAYYTLNLAVWVNELGLSKYPKSRECHLQVAIERVDGCPDDIDAALNQEDYWKMDAEQRREIIKLALCNAEMSFFSNLISLEKVTRFLRTRPRMNLAVTKSLAELAGINRT